MPQQWKNKRDRGKNGEICLSTKKKNKSCTGPESELSVAQKKKRACEP